MGHMTYPQQPMPPQYGAPPQGYAPPAPLQQYAPPTPAQFQPPAPQPGGFYTQQDPHIQAQMPPVPTQPAAPEPPAPVDTSSFFGGAASISWDDRKGYVRGTFRGGQVVSKRVSNQTKIGSNVPITWQDGSPRKQMEVTVQTAERADPQDDGQRVIFIKGDGPRAAREALKAANAKDIMPGGWYYQAWVDEEPAKQSGYNAKKIFKAVYAPPGAPDPKPANIAPPPPPAPPVPQPGQGVDQFAAYAAYQAQMAAAQQQPPQYAPPAPQQPAMAQNDQAAQFAAWQAAQGQPQHAQPGGQPAPMSPPATPQPGEWTPFSPS